MRLAPVPAPPRPAHPLPLPPPTHSLTKNARMEGVPESGTIEARSSGYNSGNIYKTMAGKRMDMTPEQGRTRIF